MWLRWRLYIPLCAGVAGASVLALHIVTMLNVGGAALRAVILASVLVAGFVTALRIDRSTVVGLFMASVASVLLHLVILERWMASAELFSGVTSPPVLLVCVFAGALAGAWHARHPRGEITTVASGVAVLILMATVQAIYGEWPVSVGSTIAALIVAQVFAHVCVELPLEGPPTGEVGAMFVASTLGVVVLSGAWLGAIGIWGTLGLTGLITLVTAVGSMAMVGFVEGLAGKTPRHQAKLPMARLLRRTW